MNWRTDIGRIEYPDGMNLSDRRHVRRMIVSIRNCYVTTDCDLILVACSGGIDSTVLVHALGQALRITPNNQIGKSIESTGLYLNHQLRLDEVEKEAIHVEDLAKKYLTFPTKALSLEVGHGPGLQVRARNARYAALTNVSRQYLDKGRHLAVMMAHNADDVAETKVYQFAKGMPITGIPDVRPLGPTIETVQLYRPLLTYSREDIVRYANCFNLTWCEDSSNKKDIYTRNLIRHKLIPLMKQINPGFIKTQM